MQCYKINNNKKDDFLTFPRNKNICNPKYNNTNYNMDEIKKKLTKITNI